MTNQPSASDVVVWAREQLAQLMGSSPEAIDPATDFDRLGLDSALAVALLIDIEERYGVDVPPEALFAHPTLNAVAEYVHSRLAQGVA